MPPRPLLCIKPRGLFNLAYLYEGVGVEKNEKKAAALYHLAADATYNLALLYEGRGVEKERRNEGSILLSSGC